MEKQFSRVRSAKDITISATLLIAGIIIMFLPYGVGLCIGGFFIFLIGALFMGLFKSVYKDDNSNDVYNKKELYFQHYYLNSLQKAIETNPGSIDISSEGKGKTVKLNIFYSKKSGKAYMQLFEYIPYMYEPLTGMIEYDIAKVANLIK